MPDTPYNEPPEIRAGDSVSWLKEDPDYPASGGYTNYYLLRNAAGAIDLTSTTGPDGGSYLTYKAASQTTGWTAGNYDWVRYVAKGTDRYTRDSGRITILPNFAGTSTYDARTDARQIYDSLITAYKSYVSSNGAMSSFAIAGKSVTFSSAAEIIQQVEHWRRIVEQEEIAGQVAKGFANPRRVGVRFVKL